LTQGGQAITKRSTRHGQAPNGQCSAIGEEKELMMTTEQLANDVEILQLAPQPVLSIRTTIKTVDLGEAVGERISAIRSYLRQSGAQPAGPPYVRYHTFDEAETDFEFGVSVVEPVAGEDRITPGELPGGEAATTWHTGPHDKLGDAYGRIAAWLKEHSREPDGAPWEVYYWINLSQDHDPSTISDPSSMRTRLIQPIK
jgi:effector-binding domain-containing protein